MVVSEFNLFLTANDNSNIQMIQFQNGNSSILVECQIKFFNTPWILECTPTNVNIQGGTFHSFTLKFLIGTLSRPDFFGVSENVYIEGRSVNVEFSTVGSSQNVTWEGISRLNAYAYTIDYGLWATITYNETVEPFRSNLSVSTNTTIENLTYIVRQIDIWWIISPLVIYGFILVLLVKIWERSKRE